MPIVTLGANGEVKDTVTAHLLADTSALGPLHTVSGLTSGQALFASGATTALFRAIAAGDIASGTLALARGGTNADLSASGSATAVLAQAADHTVSARALVAADVPGQVSDDSHRAASAAVHGLPANVNVLGSRDGAGRFIQVFTVVITAPNLASHTGAYYDNINFPVAFGSGTPYVIVSHNEYSTPLFGIIVGATFINTTKFALSLFNATNSTLTGNPSFHVIAVGQ